MDKKLTGYATIDKPWMKFYEGLEPFKPCPEATLYQALNRENPEKYYALNYFDREITYAELFQGIDSTANALAAAGIEQGDVVIFCMLNMPESVYCMYATSKIGAVANYVDLRSDVKTWKHYIDQVNPKVIVTLDMALPNVLQAIPDTSVETVVVVSLSNSMPDAVKTGYLATAGKNIPAVEYNETVIPWNQFVSNGDGTEAKEAAYNPGVCTMMFHTGGTTGLPKTVMLSDDRLQHSVWDNYYVIKFDNRHDRWYNDLPPFVCYGFAYSIHLPLVAGIEVLLFPTLSPDEFPARFMKYKPNFAAVVAEHFRRWLRDPEIQKMDLSFVKLLGIGGDKLPEDTEVEANELLKKNGSSAFVVKGYGMTENSTSASLSLPKNEIGSVGLPMYSKTIKIVDPDTFEELKYGELGEIWTESPGTMIGYLNNQEATDELMIKDEEGRVWLRSGDLARMTEEGMIFIVGRMRRIYITMHDGQGAKIFPQVAEDAIRHSASIKDVCVGCRLMKDSTFYESVAFLVKEETTEKSEQEIIEEAKTLCEEGVPSYMRPIDYVFVDMIPMTKNGKTDFKVMDQKAADMLQ